MGCLDFFLLDIMNMLSPVCPFFPLIYMFNSWSGLSVQYQLNVDRCSGYYVTCQNNANSSSIVHSFKRDKGQKSITTGYTNKLFHC